jgi:hypothetical protein
MSLDVARLEKVRELAGGLVQARCPACAEDGHDRTGEHLRIYPDGRFGCCVHPKDGEHRKRIWALAGVRKPAEICLRVKTPPPLPSTQSVKAALTGNSVRTARTGKTDSETSVPSVPNLPADDFRTGRTPIFQLRACAREDSTTANIDMAKIQEQLKDSESAVLPVLVSERLPFLTSGGDLSIPFDSPERYHWWRGGQSVAETLAEVKERMKNAISI